MELLRTCCFQASPRQIKDLISKSRTLNCKTLSTSSRRMLKVVSRKSWSPEETRKVSKNLISPPLQALMPFLTRQIPPKRKQTIEHTMGWVQGALIRFVSDNRMLQQPLTCTRILPQELVQATYSNHRARGCTRAFLMRTVAHQWKFVSQALTIRSLRNRILRCNSIHQQ